MQAAAQKWVDSSISKTINCPEDIPFSDFQDVYLKAWEMGCKGCTTYRPNDVTGSVLEVVETPEESGACELKYDEDTGQLIRSCE
jgi:ribonucleoside-diphosphate reductase alpha chain